MNQMMKDIKEIQRGAKEMGVNYGENLPLVFPNN